MLGMEYATDVVDAVGTTSEAVGAAADPELLAALDELLTALIDLRFTVWVLAAIVFAAVFAYFTVRWMK